MTSSMSQAVHAQIDPKWSRQVLGQYPTGVCAVTALRGSDPVAMVVGSFASVSLEPPLVAFFPDRGSSSWAKLRDCERFCVNILAADQEAVCRKLASKDPDKFAGTSHRISTRGNPIIDGVVAWIECDRYSISDAGDHEMVLGRVLELDIAMAGLPLLFFQGGYGRFAPSSLATLDAPGLALEQLHNVDCARPAMEQIAAELSARCIATVRIGSELAVVASAGQARRNSTVTLVGQRLPFSPPTGSIFAAWLPSTELERWLACIRNAERRQMARKVLEGVRDRGYSLGLLNEAQRVFSARLEAIVAGEARSADLEKLIEGLAYDPVDLTQAARAAIRLVSAPVFDRTGQVALALTLYDFPKPSVSEGIDGYIARLQGAAMQVTGKLGDRTP